MRRIKLFVEAGYNDSSGLPKQAKVPANAELDAWIKLFVEAGYNDGSGTPKQAKVTADAANAECDAWIT